MPAAKTGTKKKGRSFHLEFSPASAFFWSLGLLVLLAWIFVLGILVGRGFLPGEVSSLNEMKARIAKLQDIIGRKESKDLNLPKDLEKDPKFEFYDELSSRKEKKATKGAPLLKGADAPKKQEEQAPSPTLAGPYSVQIASLENGIEAADMVNRMLNKGYPARFQRVEIRGKNYFRVVCGSFTDRPKAEAFSRMLAEKEKIRGFVTRTEEPKARPASGTSTAPREKAAQGPTKGLFTVQIASLATEAEAEKMTATYVSRGYRAYFAGAIVKGKTYYRVRCGRFRTAQEAAELKDVLAKKEGVSGFITKVE
jgi:cell division septation protein DedD